MVKKNTISRSWYYFRQGWSLYFAFIFSAINTFTVTYYLAIEKMPFLDLIFPTFGHYIIIMVSIALPILMAVGYVHFKKSSAFKSEVSVNFESNPFPRRTLVNTEVILKLNYEILELIVSMNKISEEEKKKIEKIKKEMEKFSPRRKLEDKTDLDYLKSMYDS